MWDKNPVSIFEFCPLPYDNEYTEQQPVDDVSADQFYKETAASGYLENQWWIKAVA